MYRVEINLSRLAVGKRVFINGEGIDPLKDSVVLEIEFPSMDSPVLRRELADLGLSGMYLEEAQYQIGRVQAIQALAKAIE